MITPDDVVSGKRRSATVTFIFVTVVLDMITLGMIVPVLPKLIVDFVGGNMALATQFQGLFATIFAAMQFVFSPILGVLSDRFGRRPVILLSNFGLALDYLIMALAPNLGWLLVGRVISGITTASVTTASAYIVDVTAPEKRAGAFGMIGAAFGAGFVLGPAIGGIFGNIDPRLPFWVAAVMSLLNGIYGIFVLPESLPAERRSVRFDWRRANPIGSLKLLRSHHELFGLSAVNFLGYIAHEVYTTVWVLYTIYRYQWDTRMVGISLTVVGITSTLVSALLVGRVVARFGERTTMLIGLVFGVVGFVAYGLSPNGATVLISIVVGSLAGLYGPTAQGLMTHRVSASEQGELQGALASMRGIAMLIGPGLFALVFSAAIAPSHRTWNLPGAPWFLAALLVFAALIVAWRVTFSTRDAIVTTGTA